MLMENIPYCHSQLTKRIIRLRVYKSNAINYEKKNLLSLVPVKPEEFINALVKRLEHRIEEE